MFGKNLQNSVGQVPEVPAQPGPDLAGMIQDMAQKIDAIYTLVQKDLTGDSAEQPAPPPSM